MPVPVPVPMEVKKFSHFLAAFIRVLLLHWQTLISHSNDQNLSCSFSHSLASVRLFSRRLASAAAAWGMRRQDKCFVKIKCFIIPVLYVYTNRNTNISFAWRWKFAALVSSSLRMLAAKITTSFNILCRLSAIPLHLWYKPESSTFQKYRSQQTNDIEKVKYWIHEPQRLDRITN